MPRKTTRKDKRRIRQMYDFETDELNAYGRKELHKAINKTYKAVQELEVIVGMVDRIDELREVLGYFEDDFELREHK